MIRLLRYRETLSKLRSCRFLVLETKFTNFPTKIFSRPLMTRTSEKVVKRFKTEDMIPENFVIVYRGGMDTYIHLAYGTSLIMFVAGMTALVQFARDDEPVHFPMASGIKRATGLTSWTQFVIIWGAFFAMIFSMRLISTRYVLRMYYNNETRTYRAVRVGYLPIATRTHDFQAGTVKRITKKSIIPWWNLQYNCNGVKLLIIEHYFRTCADCDRMFIE